MGIRFTEMKIWGDFAICGCFYNKIVDNCHGESQVFLIRVVVHSYWCVERYIASIPVETLLLIVIKFCSSISTSQYTHGLDFMSCPESLITFMVFCRKVFWFFFFFHSKQPIFKWTLLMFINYLVYFRFLGIFFKSHLKYSVSWIMVIVSWYWFVIHKGCSLTLVKFPLKIIDFQNWKRIYKWLKSNIEIYFITSLTY